MNQKREPENNQPNKKQQKDPIKTDTKQKTKTLWLQSQDYIGKINWGRGRLERIRAGKN